MQSSQVFRDEQAEIAKEDFGSDLIVTQHCSQPTHIYLILLPQSNSFKDNKIRILTKPQRTALKLMFLKNQFSNIDNAALHQQTSHGKYALQYMALDTSMSQKTLYLI